MSDQGNNGGHRNGQDTHPSKVAGKPYHKSVGTSVGGDHRYGKPAGNSSARPYSKPAGNGARPYSKPTGDSEHRYGKPAGEGAGERPYSKPAEGGTRPYHKPSGDGARPFSRPAGNGEPRYGKPAGDGARPFSKPAGNGEHRYGKPAGDGARPYSRPTGDGARPYSRPAGDGARPYSRPAGDGARPYSRPAGDGARPYSKPAGDGARPYSRPAGDGARPYSKPAGDGARPYSRPAGDGARPYSRPAGDGARPYSRPTGDGARPYSRPAGDGEHRYGKPAGDGTRPYSKPAGDGARPYSRPAGDGARPYSRPAGDGEHRYGKPASTGARPYSRPASDGARPYNRPAGDGARPYSRPAGDGARPYNRPAGDGARPYSRPAGDGARPYSRPAGDGARPFNQPAVDNARPFSNPDAGDAPPNIKPEGDGARPYSRPVGAGARPYSRPAGGSGFGQSRFSSRPRPFGDRPRMPYARQEEAPVEQTGLTTGARRVALEVLRDVHEHGAYASLALQDRLLKAKLAPADRRLTTSIVYSTLEQQIQIDFALDRLMDHPTTEPIQRDILRLSACQILFHDRVPDSAAVNEGVNLTRVLGMEGVSGFLNAVLRNLVRSKDEIPWPKREDDLREYLHIMGSMPLWLIDKLTSVYGEELAEQIIMHRGLSHEMVLRPNMMKFTDKEFETLLNGKAWTWKPGLAPHAYLVGGATEIAMDNDYRAGNFSIQGQSSILASEAVQVKPGMRVLDACAAPGGKSCYMSEMMQNTGRIYAWELHEKRALLLESAQRRLKLENLRISIRDAAEPKPDFDGMMDVVLLDAPCSGLGVLTEKPDLKYRLQEADIAPIVESQKRLLNTLCNYVRPGGTLVYSTCSILPEENVEQVKAFLVEHPDFTIAELPASYPESIRALSSPYGLQLFAHRDGVEGFFIARLRKARA